MEAAAPVTRKGPQQQLYVRDKRNGLIHGYIETSMAARLGGDLEFVDPPLLDPLLLKYRSQRLSTTQEIREAGFKLGIDIPALLPPLKALEHYELRVNLMFAMKQLPEQLEEHVKELVPLAQKPLGDTKPVMDIPKLGDKILNVG